MTNFFSPVLTITKGLIMRVLGLSQYNYNNFQEAKSSPRLSPNFKSYGEVNMFFKESLNLFETYKKNLTALIPSSDAGKILDLSKIPDSTLKYIASNELQKMLRMSKEKIFYIITGRAGSGKSTLVRSMELNKSCYVPDADCIKPLLPYYREKGAYYVHKASCIINSANLSEAIKYGVNSVIQTTTPDYLDGIINDAKAHGYEDIKLIHINVDEDIAIDRCVIREQARGRGFDAEAIRTKKNVDSIVSTYKNPEKGISELAVYDNNGGNPFLTEYLFMKNNKYIIYFPHF